MERCLRLTRRRQPAVSQPPSLRLPLEQLPVLLWRVTGSMTRITATVSHGNRITDHLAYEAGGGFNAPVGNDKPFITYGWNVTGGVGYRFNPHLSLMAEYQFIDDKLPGSLIADAGANGGQAHIWSLTLDPVIDLFPKRRDDIYVTGGGGFYRKLTQFTDPEEVEYCYYFCEVGTENVVVSHFSSNQGWRECWPGDYASAGRPA